MLNLNCVICAELFQQSDDVHVTNCGHLFHFPCIIQWLERSKTCPQCRNKCTRRNLFRVYFNLANLDSSTVDIGTLQEQLDNNKLHLQTKENELMKAEERIKSLKESQKKTMKTITGLETEVRKKDFIILSYSEQLKMLKSDALHTETLRKEIKSLKDKLTTMDTIAFMLTATKDECEKFLETEKDPKKLSSLVAVLRRELRTCETKKNDVRNVLRIVQSDLRKEVENKKNQQERILQLESENFQLNEKLRQLESKQLPRNSLDNQSMESRSSLSKDEEYIPSNNTDDYTVFKLKSRKISPRITAQVNKIEDSNSPYFNIKSSSIGLMPLFKRNNKVSSIKELPNTTKLAPIKISPKKNEKVINDNSNKTDNDDVVCLDDTVSPLDAYATLKKSTSSGLFRKTKSDLTHRLTILKKPRLGILAESAAAGTASLMRPLKSNYVFNGMGGSERVDPFAARKLEENEAHLLLGPPLVSATPSPSLSLSSASAANYAQRLKSGDLKNLKFK